MKTNLNASRFLRPQERGMALISVLAVLFLLTLLVVAFMARTTGARASASNYRATASTRLLSDTAVNLVQAQINEATTLGLSPGGAATYTWGSQPGAIRVFDQTGALNSIYRLYSATPTNASEARVATGTSALTALASDLPSGATATWQTWGAQWCDLNSFALDAEGKYHFPILDPRDTGADPTANPTTVATLWQPASSVPALKGFSVNSPAAVGTTTNPAPMPVRWLYILKDGSIVSPDAPDHASNQLTFLNAVSATGAPDIPTVKNPIVGRIAYWTDDESSKININTAAGDDVVRGTNYFASNSIFWATPMFSTSDEVFLASAQPVAGEIQRYSGHPGTVGLNTTLSTLAGLSVPLTYTDFYSLLPRYTAGGSISATVNVPSTGNAAPSLSLTGNRLYTSVGEMIFNVNRTPSALVADTSEARANAAVERSGFFLTAHSASSELNLFGEPRISIWPWTTTYQTPADQLLAFDSTIAYTDAGTSERFYFQRTDPTSTTIDCNIDGANDGNLHLFQYLDTLTSTRIPGFGGNFTTDKYPNTSQPPAMRQIIAEIFDYVRTINVLDPLLLTQTPSGSLSRTYGQNWGAPNSSIICGGYSGSNAGSTGGNNTTYRSGGGGVQVVPSSNAGAGVNNWNSGSPPVGCQGIGSFPIPVEITVDFVALGLGARPLIPGPPPYSQKEFPVPGAQYSYPGLAHDSVYTAVPSDSIMAEPTNPTNPINGKPADCTTAMQAFVYTSFVNPALITSRMQPEFAYSMTGLNTMSVQGYVDNATTTNGFTNGPTNQIPLFFPGTSSNVGSAATFGNATDEQVMVVDNYDNSPGFINGWIGGWVFGYVPFYGETGNNNYSSSPAVLGTSPAASATWGLNVPTKLADNSMTGPATANGQSRRFPYYSQIFALPGQVNWGSSLGSPNANFVFTFNGSNNKTITLTMYSAHMDGQLVANTGKVAMYKFAFPGSSVVNNVPQLVLPNLSTGDSQIVGTMTNGGGYSTATDRWHYALAADSGATFYKAHISQNDTIQSMVLSPLWSDVRDLAMYQADAGKVNTGIGNTTGVFSTHPLYGSGNQAHDLWVQPGMPFIGNEVPSNWGRLITQIVGATNSYYPSTVSDPTVRWSNVNYPMGVPPRLNGSTGNGGSAGQGAFTYTGSTTTTGAPGDWDNGLAWQPDGPWINMADEGALLTNVDGNNASAVAYYSTGNTAQKTGISSTFSPNRMVQSPITFGSLPTGVSSTRPHPWQTLLFRPGSGAGGFGKYHWGERNEPSAGDPADHLLLDLFWMPQVEPYPISTPFATEGKINLNYEIQPFTYITRDTALRALMASEEIAVMPDSLSSSYKNNNQLIGPSSTNIAAATGGDNSGGHTRLPVDPDQTLGLNPNQLLDPHAPTSGTSSTDTAQTGVNAWYDFTANTTRFFKSASELCEMFLVPKGYDWRDFSGASWSSHSWYKIPGGDFALVGDNTRERPYSDLYSRVTTKSNTYTVYYTVQALKNAEPLTDAGQQKWDETKGGVVGEYRGATTLERYLDPNQQMPDFLGNPGAKSLEPYYKWRIVSTRQFAP